MNRLDRALGILLLLRGGKTLSAAELSRRFEVSTRTIYRDVETLAAVGVPVYAEMGRAGGFRLVEGYFLPPVMFSVRRGGFAAARASLLRSLRAQPFAAELETSEQKLLAAMPDQLRAVLAHAQQLIGFERLRPTFSTRSVRAGARPMVEPTRARPLSIFVRHPRSQDVVLDYRSPYRGSARTSSSRHHCGCCGIAIAGISSAGTPG